ncbi:Glutathione import ATP-binding protein GsiA [Sporomusa ovata DSM 2662]|uniref:Nickel transport ATP-binding protein NikD (TC 3.A.1.5.3) n=1 Tax=Sporomusa ovata TaxID=2378 RepID=A0A0U1L4M5_9FIRM|nr:ATP-binding cassette domain-containing protein [Sporomusa ovata]EQB25890.1 ABC-type dipeptide/oligopeptide/nickel transport system, ATPase component [Sporomusa ovata DSM 2662]CQR74465.1 Nickel transport ATP-binding protein NikD (TC 3.A.1.5.3) [Sporomusa ovata]
MDNLLVVRNLKVTDLRNQEEVIHGVSFELKKNSCLGIVGESGSGKSMTAKAILGLTNPWMHTEGAAKFSSEQGTLDLLQQEANTLRSIRGQRICMILQDAMSAFDPLAKIGSQMAETFIENKGLSRSEAMTMALIALKMVNMPDPEQVLKKYPHQLSGGMLQRCMVAIALAMKPDIIVADEPTTALDSINQRLVVEEFKLLRQQTGAALIFISHDLGVVQYLSDQLLVMRCGERVEYGEAKSIFQNPQHEYTKYLIDSRRELAQSFQKSMKRRAVSA